MPMRSFTLTSAYLAFYGRLGERTRHTPMFCGSSDGPRRRNILVLDPASSAPLNAIEAAGFQVTTAYGISDAKLEHALPEYDAVIIRSANRITRRMILSSPQLAAIGRAGSGVDNIDLEAACEFGVPVVNAPSGNARSVAAPSVVHGDGGILKNIARGLETWTGELAFGLMLGVSRSIPRAHDTMRRGEWAKKQFSGNMLSGKVLGVVGFGSVGREMAKIAVAFGMTVKVARRCPSSGDGEHDVAGHGDPKKIATSQDTGAIGLPLPLDDLLSVSDFVSLHVPLTVETRGMISERELALMKPSAVLVNTARGEVVDEKALLLALEGGRLGGAALDVFEAEKVPLQDHLVCLCRLPNVVCTPHIGGATQEAGNQVLGEVCNAVIAILNGTLAPERVVSRNANTSLRCAKLRHQSTSP